VRELTPFFRRLLTLVNEIGQREVLIASVNSTASHLDLFDIALLHHSGERKKPWLMPGPLCVIGVWGMDLLGRILGNRPFERPWMVKYIDLALTVNASRTHDRLSWRPRKRLLVERRIPFMAEHMKADPDEWHRRNRAALKDVQIRSNLRIHRLLEKHHDEIRKRFVEGVASPQGQDRLPSYQDVPLEILEWRFTVALRHLLNSVRTEEKGLFKAYCRDLASKRFEDGFDAIEVCLALEDLKDHCIDVVTDDPECKDLGPALYNYVNMTIQFGCDQIMETFEDLGGEFAVADE